MGVHGTMCQGHVLLLSTNLGKAREWSDRQTEAFRGKSIKGGKSIKQRSKPHQTTS